MSGEQPTEQSSLINNSGAINDDAAATALSVGEAGGGESERQPLRQNTSGKQRVLLFDLPKEDPAQVVRGGGKDAASIGLRIFLFVGCVVGQSMQNVCLPLGLSGGESMAVFLVYTAFIYMLFFSLVDVMLDPVCHLMKVPPEDRHVSIHDPRLMLVGLFNTFNGIGAVFGGSAKRTPLPLQMAIMMVSNLLAARFKIWCFNIKLPWCGTSKFHKAFWSTWVLYLGAFLMILLDRLLLAHTKNGAMSPWCLFFVFGSLAAMFYNVQQDKAQAGVEVGHLSFLAYFKQSVSLLRRQLTWLFVFAWLGVILALIPKVDQSGTLTKETFYNTWAKFLPFTNLYMNLFNVGYLISFLFGVFLNKIDSALTMTAFNVSAVVAIAAGWLPNVGMKVVGYEPNVPLTIIAILLALVGMVPSEIYSRVLREQSAEVKLTEQENLEVVNLSLSGKYGGTTTNSSEGRIRSDLGKMRDSFALGAY